MSRKDEASDDREGRDQSSEQQGTLMKPLSKEEVLLNPFVQSIWNELQMYKANDISKKDSGGVQREIQEAPEKNSLLELSVVEEVVNKVP